MRSFDIKAREYKLDQFWSALQTSNDRVYGQITSGVGDIVFKRPETNMLPNPTFDANTTTWTGYTFDPTVGHTSLGSARTTATGGILDMNSQAFPVTPGEVYYFEAWVKWDGVTLNGTGTTIGLGLTATKSDGTKTYPTVETFTHLNTPATMDWYKLSGTYTVTADIATLVIRPTVRTVAQAGTVWFDDIRMIRRDAPNQFTGSRNICSDSDTSILLNQNPGTAVTPSFNDFGLSMLLFPDTSDLWIIKFQHTVGSDMFEETYFDEFGEKTEDIGVRLNSDSSVSLFWPVDGQLTETKMIYTEQVSYFLFSRSAGTVSLTINENQISVDGDAFNLQNIQFGGGTGRALVDKIAMSFNGSLPRAYEYARLFRSNRLDTVPRPTGESSFSYLADLFTADGDHLTADRFDFSDGYYYSGVRNQYDTGLFSIEKRATFPIEYSVDRGLTWLTLPPKLYLTEVYPDVLFRHITDTDEAYYVSVKNTYAGSIALASFDVVFGGKFHLPTYIGQGYYDIEQAYFGKGSIAIASNSTGLIGTIELLGEINDTTLPLVTTPTATGMTTYVNGSPRALSTLQPYQVYHIVIVFDAPQASAVINLNQNIDMSLAGIGASDVQYTQADAFYLFNVFAGNTFLSGAVDVERVIDGVHPNSPDAKPGIVYDLQWNS